MKKDGYKLTRAWFDFAYEKKEAKATTEAANASIKAILTDEQKAKFDAWVEAKKEKMKNKEGGKGKGKKEEKEN